MWFYEEKSFHGGWSPRTSTEQPQAKTAEGTRRVFRADPVPVPQSMHGCTLDAIAAVLSPDGEFHGVDVDRLAAMMRGAPE